MDGTWLRECVHRVAALGCPVVRGNADRQRLQAPQPFQKRGFPDAREIHETGQWSAAQLTGAERDLRRHFTPTVDLQDLLSFHGSPPRDDEVLDGWRLLNPGSVAALRKAGRARRQSGPRRICPLDRVGQNWPVTFRRVPCPLAPLKAGILASGMPHAGWLAAEWVLG